MLSADQFRAPAAAGARRAPRTSPRSTRRSASAATASTTPTERTAEQTEIGIFWAYDGTPSLCAPPRLYNQIAMQIADQMRSSVVEQARLLALVNMAMADAGIAIWESKYHYQFWRPVTGIRESDAGTGPTGLGDGNPATTGDPTFSPLGAPASNLSGPNFTPPFPSYPSGHAGFGGALFQMLRRFYGTDRIPFTFVSDEFNGETVDNEGNVRPRVPRSFTACRRPRRRTARAASISASTGPSTRRRASRRGGASRTGSSTTRSNPRSAVTEGHRRGGRARLGTCDDATHRGAFTSRRRRSSRRHRASCRAAFRRSPCP